MKTFTLLVVASVLLTLLPDVHAANQAGNQGQPDSAIESSDTIIDPTRAAKLQPTMEAGKNRMENQNREQVNIQDGTGDNANTQNRTQNTYEYINDVALKVQELQSLQSDTGGIGDQVRLIAQNQVKSQEMIKIQMAKLDNRSRLARMFIGPDFGAIRLMETEMEQNRVRIEELEKLKTQMTNQGDISAIQAVIEVLNRQNLSLQNRLTAEEKVMSLLGWAFKFFAR